MQPHVSKPQENAHRTYARCGKVRYDVSTKIESPAVCGCLSCTTSTAGSQPSLVGGMAVQPKNCITYTEFAQTGRTFSDNPDLQRSFADSRRRIQDAVRAVEVKTRRGVAVSRPLHPVNVFPTRGPPQNVGVTQLVATPVFMIRTQEREGRLHFRAFLGPNQIGQLKDLHVRKALL